MNDKDMEYSQTEIEYTRGNQNHPQTKLCKYCRSEMDVRASVCPSCRKKQDHPLLTVLLIAAVSIFIVIPFLNGFRDGIKKGLNNTSTSSVDRQADKHDSEATEQESRLLFNQKDIKISYTGIEETSSRIKIKLFIENNSDTNYCVQVRDFSVNNYMIDPLFSSEIAPKKMINDTITISKSKLDENNISELENVEFKFHIFDWDHWSDGFDSDIINLS